MLKEVEKIKSCIYQIISEKKILPKGNVSKNLKYLFSEIYPSYNITIESCSLNIVF